MKGDVLWQQRLFILPEGVLLSEATRTPKELEGGAHNAPNCNLLLKEEKIIEIWIFSKI